MVDVKETLSNRIRVLRKARGLTQKGLASAAGISEPTYIDIEKARVSTSIEIVSRIAHQLGVAPWELLKPESGGLEEVLTPDQRRLRSIAATANDDEARLLLSLWDAYRAGLEAGSIGHHQPKKKH